MSKDKARGFTLSEIMPTREGWVVSVRDMSQRRGRRAVKGCPDFYTSNKDAATARLETWRAAYASESVKVTMSECLY